RVLRRRAAQLAEPHVDGGLASLEARAHLVRARARLLALDAATRVAALARAETAADALPVLTRLRRREVREIQLLLGHRLQAFSILTRWRTLRSMPASTGDSSCSALRPMRPSPSARRVPRWRPDCPIWDRTCVMRSLVIRNRPSSCAAYGAWASPRRAQRAVRPRLQAPLPEQAPPREPP